MLTAGLAQLAVKQRSELNYILASLFICIGFFQILLGMLFAGYLQTNPLLSLFIYPFTYAIGPLFYYYFKVFFNSDWKSERTILPHFLIPAVLFILIIIMIPVISPDMARNIIHSLFEDKSDPVLICVLISFAGAGLSIFCYQGVMLKDILSLYRLRELKDAQLLFFVLTAVSMLCPVLLLIACIKSDKEYLRIGILIGCFFEFSIIFIAQRYPEFLDIVKKEIYKKRYERTRLQDMDVNVINRRLRELMEEDRLYEDENISLGSLSEKLKITPHQLSEFLNRHRNVSFYTFITTYRIEQARKLLSEEPDITILQIAYSIGFNSKSAFNSAFRKFTGTTPKSFRKSSKTKRTKNPAYKQKM